MVTLKQYFKQIVLIEACTVGRQRIERATKRWSMELPKNGKKICPYFKIRIFCVCDPPQYVMLQPVTENMSSYVKSLCKNMERASESRRCE